MLDSSPLPSPLPKKLKRTASVASLPSPPPSVEHLKKRTASQRFSNGGSNAESGSDSEAEHVAEGGNVLGRKLLFPAGSSAASVQDDPDNPFLDNAKPSNARDQLVLDAACSPLAHRAQAPASPPPSRRRTAKTFAVPSRTPSPVDQRGGCIASEMPVLDEENNPFLSDSPPKLWRPRSPADLDEQPTMTYVLYVLPQLCLSCLVISRLFTARASRRHSRTRTTICPSPRMSAPVSRFPTQTTRRSLPVHLNGCSQRHAPLQT